MDLFSLLEKLFPLNRSLTGEGVRQTLKELKTILPIELKSIPSSTKVFDWEIPLEWNVEEAYLIAPDGNKIIDFSKNNLHLLGYSEPVNLKLNEFVCFYKNYFVFNLLF